MRPEVAHRRIESFAKRFGEAHLHLCYHGAFPLALTPDLLYCLRANFKRDIHGQRLEIPWVAVADLLLSPLCEEMGDELYEMDGAVRNMLLARLKEDSRFGEKRINKLSKFLLDYVEQELKSHDPDLQDFAEAQKWTGLAYVQPSQAARELAFALKKAYQEDRTELVRVASMVETFAEPLAGFDPLLVYARGMKKFVHDDWEGAVAEFDKVSGGDRELQVAGVNLPIPEPTPELPNIPIVEPKLVNSDVLEIEDITQKPPSKKLYNRDVYMLIDQSGSMARRDPEFDDKRRWEILPEVLKDHISVILNATSLDGEKIADEVYLTFFSPNRPSHLTRSITDPLQVESVFIENRPDSSTFIVPTLAQVIDHWFTNRTENKGGFIIIYTDGGFDDGNLFIQLVESTCRRLRNQDQLKIVIIGIGSDFDPTFYIRLDLNSYGFKDLYAQDCNIVVFDSLTRMNSIIELLDRQLENPEAGLPTWAIKKYPELFYLNNRYDNRLRVKATSATSA